MARFSLSPPSKSANNNNDGTAAVKPPQWKWTFPPRDRHSENDHYQSRHYRLDYSSSSSSSSDSSVSSSDGESDENDNNVFIDESDSDDDEEPPHPLGFHTTNNERYGKTRFGPTTWQAVPPRNNIFNKSNDTAWNTIIQIDHQRNNRPLMPPLRGYHLRNNCGVSTDQLIRGAAAGGNASNNASLMNGNRVQEEMKDLLEGMDRIANLVRAANHVGGQEEEENATRRHTQSSVPFNTATSFGTTTNHHNHHNQSTTTTTPSSSPHTQPRSTSKLLQLAQACELYHNTTLTTQMNQLSHQRTTQYQQSHATLQQLIQHELSTAQTAQHRIETRQKLRQEQEENERTKLQIEQRQQEERRQHQLETQQNEQRRQQQQSEQHRLKQEQHQQQLAQAERAAEEEAALKTAHVTRAQSLIENLTVVRSTTLAEFDKSKLVSKRRLQFKKVVNGRINTLSREVNKIMDVGCVVVDALEGAGREDAQHGGTSGGGGNDVGTMGKKYLLDLLASNLIVRVQAGTFNGVRGDGFPLAAMIAFVSTKCEEIGPLLEAHLYSHCPTAIPSLSLASPDGDEDELMESLGMMRDTKGEFESFDKFLSRTEGLISIMADIMSSTPSDHTLLGGHEGAMVWLERFLDLLPDAPTAPLPLLTAPVLVAFLTGAGHMLANKFPTKMKPAFDLIQNDILKRLDESAVGVPSATRLRKVMGAGFDKMRNELPPGAVVELYDGKPGTGTASSSSGGMTSFQSAAPPSATQTQNQAAPLQQGGFGSSSDRDTFSASPFGNPSQQSQTSGFAAAAAPVGGAATSPSPFGSTNQQSQSSSGFGQAAAAAPVGAATNPSPFGSTTQQPQSSGFGQAPAPAPSPFGGVSQPQAPAFGQPAAPFGATTSTTTSSSPFGAAPASNPSPFGSTQSSSGFAANSPFGAAPSSNPSPFGTRTNSSGFGNTNKKDTRPPCKFFAEGKCRNGNNCRFSHDTSGTNSGNNSGGFGSGFGQQSNTTNASPFGNSSSSSGFGGNANKRDNRPPCKFFAEGKCRNGANCKFSHDSAGAQSTSGFGNQASPFGGGSGAPAPSPFGAAPAPSPFGSSSTFGGGAAAAPTPSPFGAAPAPSPFGSTSAFGSAAPAPSPFGGGATPAPSPFGGGGFGGGMAPSPSPFGTATPFGGPRR